MIWDIWEKWTVDSECLLKCLTLTSKVEEEELTTSPKKHPTSSFSSSTRTLVSGEIEDEESEGGGVNREKGRVEFDVVDVKCKEETTTSTINPSKARKKGFERDLPS